ncbi:unnamed protein product [Sympodiomycopsis kandeliae]
MLSHFPNGDSARDWCKQITDIASKVKTKHAIISGLNTSDWVWPHMDISESISIRGCQHTYNEFFWHQLTLMFATAPELNIQQWDNDLGQPASDPFKNWVESFAWAQRARVLRGRTSFKRVVLRLPYPQRLCELMEAAWRALPDQYNRECVFAVISCEPTSLDKQIKLEAQLFRSGNLEPTQHPNFDPDDSFGSSSSGHTTSTSHTSHGAASDSSAGPITPPSPTKKGHHVESLWSTLPEPNLTPAASSGSSSASLSKSSPHPELVHSAVDPPQRELSANEVRAAWKALNESHPPCGCVFPWTNFGSIESVMRPPSVLVGDSSVIELTSGQIEEERDLEEELDDVLTDKALASSHFWSLSCRPQKA